MKIKAVVLGALMLALPAFGQKIRTIRVEPLVASDCCHQDVADLMTARLVSHLVASGVQVVEGESDVPTDAILHVTYILKAGHLEGPVRLTAMDGRVIWADEVKSQPFTRSMTTSFAEQAAVKVVGFLYKQGQK